ncbi:hypothetical protein [Pontibacillus yanchengensis]|nr:hypothetical protein [Pontibacillus yanchengensis]
MEEQQMKEILEEVIESSEGEENASVQTVVDTLIDRLQTKEV